MTLYQSPYQSPETRNTNHRRIRSGTPALSSSATGGGWGGSDAAWIAPKRDRFGLGHRRGQVWSFCRWHRHILYGESYRDVDVAKRRADQLLVDRGLAESRVKAQALIMAGLATASGRRIDKPGAALPEDADLSVAGRVHPWVSRGGIKLAFAFEHFAIDPAGAVALDIGASTGGFTDVLLAHGAALVHAVDVGRGQLAWQLRQDPRVVVHEGVNARYLSRGEVPDRSI